MITLWSHVARFDESSVIQQKVAHQLVFIIPSKFTPRREMLSDSGKYGSTLKYKGIIKSFTYFPYESLDLIDGIVYYGPTQLSARSIQIYWDNVDLPSGKVIRAGDGVAEGNVTLHDPIGSVTCDSLFFNSRLHTAVANSITLRLENSLIVAKKLTIIPGQWTFDHVRIRNLGKRVVYDLKLKTMVIKPGETISGDDVRITLFGKSFVTLPHISQNLSKEIFGIRAPFPSYSPQNGASLNFGSSLLIGPQSVLGINASASTLYTPSYSIQLSQSFLGQKQVDQLITPISDLSPRFQYGYFDNIEVSNPWDESAYIGSNRDTLSFGTFVNSNTFDRRQKQTFDEPLVVTYEHSQKVGSFGLLSDLHLESINAIGSNSQVRGVVSISALPMKWKISPNMLVQARIDSTGYFGTHQFEWVRGEFGLVSRLTPHIRLGFGLVRASEFGVAQFTSDQLYAKNAYFARIDVADGPRNFSLLEKYDSDRHAFYDQELLFSQAAGLFQPFIAVRLFPQALVFGLRVRLQGLSNQLQSRNPKRPTVQHKNMQLSS